MKCIIVYFSQTGNTELVAKSIQKGILQKAGHCEIANIKEVNPRCLFEYDLIGLGCPVFDFVEPGNVRAFINDIHFVGGKHAFVFSTHGCVPEYFFSSIVPRLKKRGLTVIGMRDWYAKCYLSQMPDPYPTEGHPDEIDLKEAEDFGTQMVEYSLRISSGETNLIPPVPEAPPPFPDPAELGFTELMTQAKSMVKFHKEKCLYPTCRLCMDNCPMDGIDLSIKPPVVARPCIQCTFCAKICPTGALEIDAWVRAMLDFNMVSFEKLLLPALKQAEKEGRFRRLLPIEKIGYDNPICKHNNGHPQWIIGKGLQ